MDDHSTQGPDAILDICRAYETKARTYGRFASECESLIRQWIEAKGIRVHSVTSREKDPAKLDEKLRRPGKHYECLEEVTDLAGVRVITYLEDECNAIAILIEQEFEILPEHSIDKASTLEPDRFGYVSIHYVFRLPATRASLTENAEYKGLLCEVQIRSILQHAWAEIEHDLGYKSAAEVPEHIRRRFSRLAAHLETADEEFMRVRDELSNYETSIEAAIVANPNKVLLDQLSLTAYVNRSSLVLRLDKALAEVVYGEVTRDLISLQRALLVLPRVGIKTVRDLDEALSQREELLVRYFKDQFADHRHPYMSSGACLDHLWQIMVVERLGPLQLEEQLISFGWDAPEAQTRARDIAEGVTRLEGEERQ